MSTTVIPAESTAELTRLVARYEAAGWKVGYASSTSVTVTKRGAKVVPWNPLKARHLWGAFFTCGTWAMVWFSIVSVYSWWAWVLPIHRDRSKRIAVIVDGELPHVVRSSLIVMSMAGLRFIPADATEQRQLLQRLICWSNHDSAVSDGWKPGGGPYGAVELPPSICAKGYGDLRLKPGGSVIPCNKDATTWVIVPVNSGDTAPISTGTCVEPAPVGPCG